jgi:hypothetical protein
MKMQSSAVGLKMCQEIVGQSAFRRGLAGCRHRVTATSGAQIYFMILRPSVQARIRHCDFVGLALRPFSSAMATANATHDSLDPNNSSKNTLKLENVCQTWRERRNYEAKGSNI